MHGQIVGFKQPVSDGNFSSIEISDLSTENYFFSRISHLESCSCGTDYSCLK